MSTILKCDITGKADVPTFKVSPSIESVEHNVAMFRCIIDGERVEYLLTIHNKNGYSAIDVAQEYVYEELIKNLTQMLNELKNPAVNQSRDI